MPDLEAPAKDDLEREDDTNVLPEWALKEITQEELNDLYRKVRRLRLWETPRYIN